jgi:HSP20 family protein
MSLLPHGNRPLRKKGPFGLGSFFEDIEEGFKALTSQPSGLSVSSDEKNIYILADVPGLTAKDVEVSVDGQGCLWIKGERVEEKNDKNKKFYRKAVQSFSYCVPLWNEIDESVEPEASCKNGVMRIVFKKKKDKQVEAKKIRVKE